jgi:hypothetical protein
LNRFAGSSPNGESQPAKSSTAGINEDDSKKLLSQLIEGSRLSAQPRGYEFEKFLKNLFNAYGLSGRAPFRLAGEQIVGSIVMRHETYLLAAKWENSPIGAAHLHIFEGKLGQKASGPRGLFFSISGLSEDGLLSFGKGKRLVCMDGCDLSEMLLKKISVVDALTANVRSAAETGNPFIRVRDLIL